MLIIVFLLILAPKKYVLCQEDSLKKIELSFTAMTGTYFATFANGFMDDYSSILGGQKKDFKFNESFSFILSAQWQNNYRVSLRTNTIRYTLQDNFLKETFDSSNVWRKYREDINSFTIPILFSLDWYFFYDKYKSFLSGALGVSYSKFEWKEIVWTPLKNDIRTGGELYNATMLYPTIAFSSGIQLDFDKGSVPNFIRGLIMSADFQYVFRRSDVFNKLRQQFNPVPDELKDKQFLIPFSIGLNIGIVFNLDSKQINRVFGKN